MIRFRFHEEKAIASVLFLAQELISLKDSRAKPDFHKIFKILYFADQKHMARYGYPIVGDYYIAMEHGPVPSGIYDILKVVRGDSIFPDSGNYGRYFKAKSRFLHPKVAADMDAIAESELECLRESLEENQFLSFIELKTKSHDRAYRCAVKNDQISFREMARMGGADENMVAYIHTISENEKSLSR